MSGELTELSESDVYPARSDFSMNSSQSEDTDDGLTERSWHSIEQQLRSIDGVNSDTVMIPSAGNSYMGISGGNDGRYVVGGYIDEKGSFICASGEDGHPKDVAVCDDFNEYPSINVVTLDAALIAAKEFFETGGLSTKLKWSWSRKCGD